MAPDRSQDDRSNVRNRPPHNEERNPFIAFRRQVDSQLGSLFRSISSLPSAIYDHGQDHSRLWTQHRHDRLREIDKEEQEETRGLEKEWERAMKDFEDSEKEVKEWYDKVLRQITQRRDEHLESGMGFGGMERGMQAGVGQDADVDAQNLQCPYLPPKQQRLPSPVMVDKSDELEHCKHPKGWVCERDYPQSRFLDWVWTGWGGPSTTPNMLWHRGHKRDIAQQDSPEVESKGHLVKQGPDLSLDDPAVQQAMSTGICLATGDSELDASKGQSPLPLFSFLVFNKNSPLQLERDTDLGMFGTQWRDAYEDLLRAERNEPLTSSQDSLENEQRLPHEWLERILRLKKESDDERRALSGEAIDIRRRGVFGSHEEGQAWECLQLQHQQGLETQQPNTELEAFLRLDPLDTVGSLGASPFEPIVEQPISTRTIRNQRDDEDGTSTLTCTIVDTFSGGQQKIRESTSRWNSNGDVISNTEQTRYTSSSTTHDLPKNWEQKETPTGRRYYVNHNTRTTSWDSPNSTSNPDALPSGWERKLGRDGEPYYIDHNTKTTTMRHPEDGFVMPKNRNEFEQLVRERFSQAKGQHMENRTTPRSGSGWFWKN